MRKLSRVVSMIVIGVVAAIAVLALLTQAGVVWLQRKFPPQGEMIGVRGGALHVVDLGPRDLAEPPVVLVHGASSNLNAMRAPLGEMLAQRHRVILVDCPGHGWSPRADVAATSLSRQAREIGDALDALGVSRAVFVVHSMGGAVGTRMALDQPHRVAGLITLGAATHPWPGGGVGTLNKLLTTPVIGPLLAYTVTLPLGLFLVEPGARAVFAPQSMPADYVDSTATPLLLRPRELLANAWDLTRLNAALRAQAASYSEIAAPTVVLHGDADTTVSLDVHARAFAAQVPGAKLIVLRGVGHMVQNAVPDLVRQEVETLIAQAEPLRRAAAR